MPQALPLTNEISQASTRKRKYRTLSVQFGDGYSQETPDGTNNIVDEWNIVYENLETSQRNTLLAALDTVKSSDYFTWQAPGDGASKRWKVTLDGWSERPKAGDKWDISFTLRQVF